ncbi:MAG: flagellar hook-length control protein FliK [Lentisphaeria bacterium]|nr:flagellar hook-length control protein FliK [Lentisphaeria bacterium]
MSAILPVSSSLPPALSQEISIPVSTEMVDASLMQNAKQPSQDAIAQFQKAMLGADESGLDSQKQISNANGISVDTQFVQEALPELQGRQKLLVTISGRQTPVVETVLDVTLQNTAYVAQEASGMSAKYAAITSDATSVSMPSASQESTVSQVSMGGDAQVKVMPAVHEGTSANVAPAIQANQSVKAAPVANAPSVAPSVAPSAVDTSAPSVAPSAVDTSAPSVAPSAVDTSAPSVAQSAVATAAPSVATSVVVLSTQGPFEPVAVSITPQVPSTPEQPSVIAAPVQPESPNVTIATETPTVVSSSVTTENSVLLDKQAVGESAKPIERSAATEKAPAEVARTRSVVESREASKIEDKDEEAEQPPVLQAAVSIPLEAPHVIEAAPLAVAPVAVNEVDAASAMSARSNELVEAAEAVCSAIMVSQGLSKSEGEIHIQLKADVLGGSDIRLAVNGGALSITFNVVTDAVQHLIEQNLPQFEQHLAQHIHAYQIAVDIIKRKVQK